MACEKSDLLQFPRRPRGLPPDPRRARSCARPRSTALLPALKSTLAEAISWPCEVIQTRRRKWRGTFHAERNGEALARKNLLGRSNAFQLHRQSRRAAGRNREYLDAALARANGFRQCVALGFISVTDQHDAPRSLRRESAERELHASQRYRWPCRRWDPVRREWSLCGLRRHRVRASAFSAKVIRRNSAPDFFFTRSRKMACPRSHRFARHARRRCPSPR